eukprot:EG_transcript_3032
MEERIAALTARLTVAQKAALAAGETTWTTVPVPELGIPPLKVTDGPNGARGDRYLGRAPAACFPVGIALAASWDPSLVRRVGEALAQEVRDKGAHLLLGPTINLHRTPVGGRNFECFSEDPHLTARLAVAYIEGLQSQGVAACAKHFVCNDTEYQRNSISSDVPERALRELYLEPFRACVQEAHVWSVMSAYNKVDGTYCSENGDLLRSILKGEWGFDGLVMSDWGGTYSTVPAALCGLDLEMPGPPKYFGPALATAVEEGRVPEALVDDTVRRLLRLLHRTGVLDGPPGLAEEQGVDRPETRALAHRAAVEALVLLRNEGGLLPLPATPPQGNARLAVIGPYAQDAQAQGGGSAKVRPHYCVSPYDAIVARAAGYTVTHHAGCYGGQCLPALDQAFVPQGFRVEYFNATDLTGTPVLVQEGLSKAEWLALGQPEAAVSGEMHCLAAEGTLEVAEGGVHTFALVCVGYARVLLDGEVILDQWETFTMGGPAFFGVSGPQAVAEVPLQDGSSHTIRLEFRQMAGCPLTGARIGHRPPQPADPLAEAVLAAQEADVVVLCIGLGEDYDCEGKDKPSLDLPPDQLRLLEEVAAANPNVAVVLSIGSPIAMPWLDRVRSVLVAWYPGQEVGNAVADVLFGAANPSGRLPQTFPRRLEDHPAFLNYPGEAGHVLYGEGLFMGYRYYLKKCIEPLFHFGFGLSYTSFSLQNLAVVEPPAGAAGTDRGAVAATVTVEVTNTGDRRGKEVVQVYLQAVEPRLVRPPWELKAFQKVEVEAGQTATVTIHLGARAFACYDPARRGWVAEAGPYVVGVGRHAGDLALRHSFRLPTEAFFPNDVGHGTA